ncbi:hypothetical protein Krac_2216 [Ktedonobacter racemifer DSM 44963]|uniref:Uncharacterized protein n=1 Tax=Ktedonobacter racemifer DSM 44963 TaxID=485913 RepID=D6U4R0_KTERA|nr:hypothetical protein Krac_2216 [Ktedonobacter racemifer DSM 44963]
MRFPHCLARYLYPVVLFIPSHRHTPTHSRPKGSLRPFAGQVSPLLSSNR